MDNILSNRQFGEKAILDTLGIGFSLINRQMEVIWTNKTAESLFGKTNSCAKKKCYVYFTHRSDICENCPAEKTFRDKKSHTSDLRTATTANGEKRCYRLITTPILNGKGAVEKVLETAIDITEKRKRDIGSRRHSVNMRKLTKNVVEITEVFKKLADKNSAKLQLANEELKNIYALGNMLIASLDVNEVINSIANTVPKLLKVSGCIVRIIDETKTRLRLEATYGTSSEFKEEARMVPVGEGISGMVAKTGLPITIPDLSRDSRVKYQRECSREGIRAVLAVPIAFKGKLLGVLIAFSKKTKYFDSSEVNVLSIFAAHAAIALNNAMLYNKVHLNYYNTMLTLVKAMEARDPYTCGHSERVTGYAIKIAQGLNLNGNAIRLLMYAGKLHDIGKIAIPDFILKKTTKLTPAERAAIETHPIKGIEMIVRLKFLEKCLPLIRHHHERYDGNGYPDRLKGKKIPLLARILSISDAFDAMISERPYRKGLSIEKAIKEIERNSATQFDPQLAELFLLILQKSSGLKETTEILPQTINLAS